MFGLTVDMHQKSLVLPFQTQILKKHKTQSAKTPPKKKKPPAQPSGIKYILLVLNKSHFIFNQIMSF